MPDLQPISTEKEDKLELIESDLVELGDYKTRLEFDSDKVYSERIEQLDYFLSTGLGQSMRDNLTKVRKKIKDEGQAVYIAKELTRINSDIVKSNVEKDELISR